MKVGEFQRAINVTSKSYGDFMKQSGTHKGSESSTYGQCIPFLQEDGVERREIANCCDEGWEGEDGS